MERKNKERNFGKRIGYLTVKGYDDVGGVYVAQCDCGANVTVTERSLLKGTTQGCPRCTESLPGRRNNLSGKKFGVLNVLFPYTVDGQRKRGWICACDKCGARMVFSAKSLLDGEQYSCPKCGAGRSKQDQMDPSFSLTCHKFGNLKATFHPINKRMVTEDNDDWMCLCTCGERITLNRRELYSGKYTHCGCMSGRNSLSGYRTPCKPTGMCG